MLETYAKDNTELPAVKSTITPELDSWIHNNENTYAFNRSSLSNEHAYMDKVGYIHKSPEQIETSALRRCCTLLGASLLLMLAISVAQTLVLSQIYHYSPPSVQNYNNKIAFNDVSFEICGVMCAFTMIKHLLPMAVFMIFAKLPTKAGFPSKVQDKGFYKLALPFMLLSTILGAIGNNVASAVLTNFRIDVPIYSFIYSSDMRALILFALTEYILSSIMIELFFRGAVMQTFRQFGDSFAIFVCCFVNALYFADLSNIPYIFFIGVVTGIFCCKTGSVLTAITMRIFARVLSYLLFIIRYQINSEYPIFAEYSVYILVLAISLLWIARLLRSEKLDFRINNNATCLTFRAKVTVFLSSNTITVWLAGVLVVIIASIRFVN